MKPFFLFLAILFSVLLVLDRGLALVMDQMFGHVRTGQHGGKINYYLSEPVPQLVIMGSSRAIHQVDPDSFRIKAFNLGHGGMFMPFHTGLLRMMEENKKLPPVILLQIDPYEFVGVPKIRDAQHLSYFYHRSDTLRRYIDELSVFEKYKYYFDLYRYNSKSVNVVKEYIRSGKTSERGNGYESVPVTERDSLNILSLANGERPDTNLTVIPGQFRYLKSFIEICRRNNIRLICFTSPIFKSRDSFRIGSVEVEQLLRHNGIPYLNYTESLVPELQERTSYWRDLIHLNQKGAAIFGGILARQVEEFLSDQPENATVGTPQ